MAGFDDVDSELPRLSIERPGRGRNGSSLDCVDDLVALLQACRYTCGFPSLILGVVVRPEDLPVLVLKEDVEMLVSFSINPVDTGQSRVLMDR